MKRIVYFTAILLVVSNSGYTPQNLSPTSLNLLFMRDAFPGVELTDVSSALDIWIDLQKESIFKQSKLVIEVNYTVLEDPSQLESIVRKKKFDLINIPTNLYRINNTFSKYTPIISASRNNEKFEQFVIIANKQSTINSIEELNRKTLVLMKDYVYDLSRIWLDVQLKKYGINNKNDFLYTIQVEPNELNAINRIFFRKDEAALVTLSKLTLANELNPQTLKKIKVIDRSEPFILSVSLIKNDLDETFKELVKKSTTSFHMDSRSQQILDMFKIARMYELNEGDLDLTLDLIRNFEKLK